MNLITLAKIGTHQTTAYTVEELARYLKMMDKKFFIDQRTYEKYDESVQDVIWVGLNDWVPANSIHDEILIDVKNGAGVITGANKGVDKGKLVSTFLMGSQKVYDFIDDNPMVQMMDVGYTNDPFVIAKHPKMTAINSALQIDLTGQVCADSLGTKFYSGVGGQVDFIYGASLAPQGKAIIAMPSTTNKGGSKIAPVIIEGGGIVTTRPHVHHVVTEFGSVDLYGKSLQERAKLLISIAHPDHQEELDRAAFERFGPHYTTVKI